MNRTKKCSVLLLAFVASLSLASSSHALEQYKKHNRDAISLIVDGKVDTAIKRMASYLEEHPDDLEALYALAVAYSQKQDIDKALDHVKQALEAGIPFGRFLAGPRDLLKPLTDSAKFKVLAKKHGEQLLHGPMLAVHAPLEEIEKALEEEGFAVAFAHRNGPAQGSLSGSRAAIERVAEFFDRKGWRHFDEHGMFRLMEGLRDRFPRKLSHAGPRKFAYHDLG